MAWTPELVEDLQRLWNEGLTTGEIGKRLGVSKNAVVGKAHRLGLESRPSPIHREEKTKEKPVKAKKKAAVKKAPKKKEKLVLNDLHFNSCRWPIGDPKDPDFHFCGKETFMGRPYCAEHCLKAYVGIHKHKK
ncbi:MAG: global cell cycle regulator GcrA-like protein [Alphaproteobacteria bacterium]|nr:GcrA family cell cycle regulator [Alphaproteobacteria bacterium]NCB49592.1 global cell cycle regulator GcrA-like protein [Alphaproteobacteria bacterium]